MQHVHFKKSAGEQLVAEATRFERRSDGDVSFLVLGDSLAFGVGASSPEKSFAGLLGEQFPDVDIVNKAAVGYDTADLAAGAEDLIDRPYTTVFVIIGGNDIIRYRTDLNASRSHLQTLYTVASAQAAHVYVITTGDFKDVSIVPWGIRSHFSERSDRLRSDASELAEPLDNVTYIDAYGMANEHYRRYEAVDGFHLNDAGIESLVNLTASSIEAT